MLRVKLKRTLVQRHLWWLAEAALAGLSLARSLPRRARAAGRGAAVRSYLESHAVRKLQIGCGNNVLPGWLNTDLEPADARVALLDASRPMPFGGATFDYVFTEHVIEHLDYLLGEVMLRECFRVLRPGGTLRVATPDLAFLVRLYGGEKTQIERDYVRWSVDTFQAHIGVYQDAVVLNNFFRNWGHRFIYDEAALAHALAAAGFADVRRCAVGESAHEPLRGLESHGREISEPFNRLETMVLEARKPGGAA